MSRRPVSALLTGRRRASCAHASSDSRGLGVATPASSTTGISESLPRSSISAIST